MKRSTVKPLTGPRPKSFLSHEEALAEVERQNEARRVAPVGTIRWTDALAHRVPEKTCGCHWLCTAPRVWLRIHCDAHALRRLEDSLGEVEARLWPGAKFVPRPAQDTEELVMGFMGCGKGVLEYRPVDRRRLPALERKVVPREQ